MLMLWEKYISLSPVFFFRFSRFNFYFISSCFFIILSFCSQLRRVCRFEKENKYARSQSWVVCEHWAPSKACWYPWKYIKFNVSHILMLCKCTLNFKFFSPSVVPIASYVRLLAYSVLKTQKFMCNKSSIKTCKDFAKKKFGSVTSSDSFPFFLLVLFCGFLSSWCVLRL